MRVIVGMATHDGRSDIRQQALDSLRYQADNIFLYDNSINPDLADNGKFYGLLKSNDPCYYFSCDDDLIYPPNYVNRMINEIESLGTIVTCHGRLLKGKDLNYYLGHKVYPFHGQTPSRRIDVAGTGVTAFRTDYFNPVGIHKAKDKYMSDMVFSWEAAKQEKLITLISHPEGWIKQIPVTSSIKFDQKNNTKQIKYANSIWELKSQHSKS